jgi:hypothetical protein
MVQLRTHVPRKLTLEEHATWPRRAALRVFLNRLAPRAAARALLRKRAGYAAAPG